MKYLKGLSLVLIMAASFGIMADPPRPTPGGVSCKPGCHIFECATRYCIACNSEGCVIIPA